MKVVDPHIHLWDLSTGLYPGLEKPSTGFIGSNEPIARSYMLDELLSEGGDEIEIVKIVNVEAFPTDSVAETAYLQSLADRTGYPQGIVAGADLSRPDAEAMLERQASFANVRGIRQVLNMHPDPLYAYVARDYMADPVWMRNFALLGRHGLSFDLQLYPHQMRQAVDLVRAHPGIAVIVNHAGMFADRTLSGWRQWRDGMRALASSPDVAVKISGLGMLDTGWSLESIRPYVLETLDAFGCGRVMFASNFPVDKLFGTYTATWRAFAAIVSDLSDTEKQAMFSANAERIYRI
ncbi:MAG: amidohydrolase family protein [Rhizobiaceae bacterium]|nr:amidohydrolase family protein [Rhizobiaceae bacterium]